MKEAPKDLRSIRPMTEHNPRIDYAEKSTEQLESLADMFARHHSQARDASRAAGPTSGKRWEVAMKEYMMELHAIDEELQRRPKGEGDGVNVNVDGDANAGKELVTDGGHVCDEHLDPVDLPWVDVEVREKYDLYSCTVCGRVRAFESEPDVDLEAVARFVDIHLEASFKVTDAERAEVMSDVRGLLERPLTEDQVAYPMDWAGTAVDVKCEIVDGVEERFGFEPIEEDPNAGKELVTDGGTNMQVPDGAMQVNHGIDSDHENYVQFTVTDVVEWWTKSEDGTVTVEKFVADSPTHPEDISIGLAATEVTR